MVLGLGVYFSYNLSLELVVVEICTGGISIWLRGYARNMGPYFFNLTFCHVYVSSFM
jgi:hypothetical protein